MLKSPHSRTARWSHECGILRFYFPPFTHNPHINLNMAFMMGLLPTWLASAPCMCLTILCLISRFPNMPLWPLCHSLIMLFPHPKSLPCLFIWVSLPQHGKPQLWKMLESHFWTLLADSEAISPMFHMQFVYTSSKTMTITCYVICMSFYVILESKAMVSQQGLCLAQCLEHRRHSIYIYWLNPSVLFILFR